MKLKKLPKAIIFDFDGVILESVNTKNNAFLELFKKYPQKKLIASFLEKNSGVNRFLKFEYIFTKILNKKCWKSHQIRLSNKFNKLVIKKLLSCKFVKGALPILKKYSNKIPLYVVSASPIKELKKIIYKRKLNIFFKSIYGYPLIKSDAIQMILNQEKLEPKDVIFIGDTKADWLAAKKTGVNFCGRVSDNKNSVFPHSILKKSNLFEFMKLLEDVSPR